MNAFASTVAICIMGALSYLFCLFFPPFKETAPVVALLSMFALGAIGAFLWQESEAWFMTPLQWATGCLGLSAVSLVIFFANSWHIGLSPREAILFPKHVWETLNIVDDHLSYKGIRYSLAFGIGSLILGTGSLVRWGLLSLKSPQTTRSTRAARKRAAS